MYKFAFSVVIKSIFSLVRHAEINFHLVRHGDYDDGREGA